MGFFSDFFRFVASVMLGKQDSSHTFFEPLIMAERYLRWGGQRQDMRDFQRAMEYLLNVRDEEAPRPDLLLRKYLCLVDISEGSIKLLIAQFQQTQERLLRAREEKTKEAQNLRSSIAALRNRIEDLKKEGSLIKAREEERRLEESNLRLQVLEQDLLNKPEENEIRQEFGRLVAKTETLLQDVDRALTIIQSRTDITGSALNNFSEQVTARVEKLRQEIAAANPASAISPGSSGAVMPAAESSSPVSPPDPSSSSSEEAGKSGK